jgi:hypothetical protein
VGPVAHIAAFHVDTVIVLEVRVAVEFCTLHADVVSWAGPNVFRHS